MMQSCQCDCCRRNRMERSVADSHLKTAELLIAKLDTRRLDWLEKHPGAVQYLVPAGWQMVSPDGFFDARGVFFKTLRSAIDSAISAQSEKTK